MFPVEIKEISMYSHIGKYPPISYFAEKGSTNVFTGPCGSGKSYLLELAASIKTPNSGTVLWEHKNIADLTESSFRKMQLKSSVVFQQPTLISFLPVFENVALPLRYHKLFTPDVINRKVRAILRQFSLSKFSYHLPERLSSGQKKLVAIARALVISPELLFLDEPTESLDPVQEQNIIDTIKILTMVPRTTIFIASDHDNLLKQIDASFFLLDGRDTHLYTNYSDLQKAQGLQKVIG